MDNQNSLENQKSASAVSAQPNVVKSGQQTELPAVKVGGPDPEQRQNTFAESLHATIKSRLEPDHSQPINKRKLLYSIVIMVLALIVIGLLQSQSL